MENLKRGLTVEPNQSSGRNLTGKIFIGLIVGGTISLLLFIILSFVGGVFTNSIGQTGEFIKTNPILPLIILLIGFLGSFIGNLAIAGIYNLFFSEIYTKTVKTFGILLLTNGILFVFFTPVYLISSNDINTLFLILGFHIMFSVFLSTQQIETVSNPNYGSSSLIGTTLGFVTTILIYTIIRKNSSTGGTESQIYLLLLVPPIIGFSIMPLGLGIREKIYYKMYEIGNNGFYTPPIENETKNTTQNINLIDENDDINIDLQ